MQDVKLPWLLHHVFSTAIFAISLCSIAMLACNPSIGGTSGSSSEEIDALGGEMGINE